VQGNRQKKMGPVQTITKSKKGWSHRRKGLIGMLSGRKVVQPQGRLTTKGGTNRNPRKRRVSWK